jgi:capsule polysaccharide export protein KpsE/RkpR
LSSRQDQHSGKAEEDSETLQVPIGELLSSLSRQRRLIAVTTTAGILLTAGISLLIPNQYTSSALLMPPDQQALTSVSMLAALAGAGSAFSSASLGSSLTNQKTVGGTLAGILRSRTSLDDIVNQYDLRKVYHAEYQYEARDKLDKATLITEDKKSGLITIEVTDTDPNRARDLAASYVVELDKLVNAVSTSSARRERIFLEERVQTIKKDLDESSLALSQFSSRNATMDPGKQGVATIEAASRLQDELIAMQSQLSGLQATYADNNVRVRELRARIEMLRGQLQKMGGDSSSPDSAGLKDNQLLPSVRQIPLIGYTYYNLYRKVEMLESTYQTLSKQLELAKVQEVKEIPRIKVLDEPVPAERKSGPHRSYFVLIAAVFSFFASAFWVMGRAWWTIYSSAGTEKKPA